MIKKFQSTRLRNKILLAAVLSQLVIAVVAAALGLNLLRRNSDLLSQSAMLALQSVSDNLSNTMMQVDQLTYKILSDSTIQEQLGRISVLNNSQEQLLSYHGIYERLIHFLNEYQGLGILDITLVTDAYDVTTAYTGKDFTFHGYRDKLMNGAAENEGRVIFDTGGSTDGELYAARVIRRVSPFDLSITGTMIVTISLDQLMSRHANVGTTSCLWVLDQEGIPFYRSKAMTEEDMRVLTGSVSKATGVICLSGEHFFVSRGILPGTGWGYMLLMRYEEQWQSRQRSYTVFFAALICSIALSALISGIAARSITRRTDALLDKINRFQLQMTDSVRSQSSDLSQGDEISILHSHFDDMASQIRTLVQDKYVSELLSREAQLRALEAQINPHFLYNVLETVSSRARLAGNMTICTIIEALGRLLRVSLDTRTKTLTLREELNLVRDYITIQKERYEDQLLYTEEVLEDLMEIQVPKMIIQPLVENAIKYALENGIDDCCEIQVTAEQKGDDVVILVTNSGSLFPETMLGVLDPDGITSHGLGIGLVNIHQRLKLTYGESSEIRLENGPDSAVCRLRIPLQGSHKAEGDENHCCA